MSLTKAFCDKITTTGKPARYSDGRNLYLYVSKTGAKSWSFVWQQNGRQRELGLGSYTGAGFHYAVDIQTARSLAQKVRDQLAMGIDPIKAREAARIADTVASTTFADVNKDAVAVQKQEWHAEADGTFAQEKKWTSSLEQHAAKLMKKRIALVNDQDVIDVLKPIWTTKAQTASRLMYRIGKVMELAITKGLHKGPNPARYAGHIEVILGKKAGKAAKDGGHKAMHYNDIPAFWPELLTGNGMATKALAFVILTAVRTDEARLAQWSEIDFDKAVWTIPADRMKVKTAEHIVPLSKQAIELLRSIPQVPGTDFIFAGKKKGSSIGETALKDRLCDPKAEGGLGLQGEATVHGMRSTFSDWVGEETNFQKEDREHCLAHKLDAVEGAYRRKTAVEKRRKIMQAWADHATGAAGANVVRLAA